MRFWRAAPLQLSAAIAVALWAAHGCSEGGPPAPPARVPEPFQFNRYKQSFGYSQAIKIGRAVYISASVAVDDESKLIGSGDVAAQLAAVYANLAATLAAEGGGFAPVVMERGYATDMGALLTSADRRLHFYPEGQRPATTWIEVRRLVDPGFLVAVEAVAELS